MRNKKGWKWAIAMHKHRMVGFAGISYRGALHFSCKDSDHDTNSRGLPVTDSIHIYKLLKETVAKIAYTNIPIWCNLARYKLHSGIWQIFKVFSSWIIVLCSLETGAPFSSNLIPLFYLNSPQANHQQISCLHKE